MGLDGDDRGRQPVQLRLKGERERERERQERESETGEKRYAAITEKKKKRRFERLEGKIAFYKRK